MPIYDFQCSSCGHKSELMRKVSEANVTTCPSCQQATFTKMLSAPSFQLNGTGWYATDFKGTANNASTPKAEEASAPAACSPGCACH